MLTWILLILALIVLTVLFTWIFGSLFGRGEILPPTEEPEDLIRRNRECIAAGDFAGLGFDVVPRGYRPEQVEALIADLEKRCVELSERGNDLSIGKND